MQPAVPSTIALAASFIGAIASAGVAWSKPGGSADRPSQTRRDGRAVRVPRSTVAVTTNARFCSLSEDDRGLCFAPVAVGDDGTVLSTDGSNWGQTTIVEVTPNLNRCGQADTWTIRIDRARLKNFYDYGATLVVGVPLTTQSQLMPANRPMPDDNQLASIMYVVDVDGDAQADLIADQYGCDGARQPTASGAPTHQCYEYWVAVRDRWQRGRVDQTATCSR